ncbi:MAG: hypothetical protein ABI534_05610 [Chloroflexota bacterium]
MTDRCVFCGDPIGADAERTGRGAMAAHAACADRALADDAHWDAIAGASEVEDDERPAAPRARGCLLVIALLVVVALIVAASNGFASFWAG